MKQAMSGFCIQAGDFHNVNKKASCNATGTKYGRWNPTSEQVKVLTDLFRSGLRTPSIHQIQKISSELSSYGTIESKNVFYWFQNHKARERQKRQRVTEEGSIVKHVDAPTYCVDDTCQIRPESKTERKTLQLFPVSGDVETGQQERVTMPTNQHIENEKSSHPPLDLSLSFY